MVSRTTTGGTPAGSAVGAGVAGMGVAGDVGAGVDVGLAVGVGAARGLLTGTERDGADDRRQGDCCDAGGGDAAGRGTGGWHVMDPFEP